MEDTQKEVTRSDRMSGGDEEIHHSDSVSSLGVEESEHSKEPEQPSGTGGKRPVFPILAVVVVIAIVGIGFFTVFGKSDVDRFVDYVRDEGVLSATQTGSGNQDVSYELRVDSDGTLRMTMSEALYRQVSGAGNISVSRDMLLSFRSGDPIAQINMMTRMAIDSTTREVLSIGELDIASYQFGDEVHWTYVEDSSNPNSSDNDQDGSPELIESVIRQLQVFVDDSDTGCTMQMLGFKNLS